MRISISILLLALLGIWGCNGDDCTCASPKECVDDRCICPEEFYTFGNDCVLPSPGLLIVEDHLCSCLNDTIFVQYVTSDTPNPQIGFQHRDGRTGALYFTDISSAKDSLGRNLFGERFFSDFCLLDTIQVYGYWYGTIDLENHVLESKWEWYRTPGSLVDPVEVCTVNASL